MIRVCFRCPTHGTMVQPAQHDCPADNQFVGPKLMFIDEPHLHEAEHAWTFNLEEMSCDGDDSDDDESCRKSWLVVIEVG